MTYKLQCKACGATCWCRGDYDPSVNALELDDSKTLEWEGGSETCEHGNFDIVDEDLVDDE